VRKVIEAPETVSVRVAAQMLGISRGRVYHLLQRRQLERAPNPTNEGWTAITVDSIERRQAQKAAAQAKCAQAKARRERCAPKHFWIGGPCRVQRLKAVRLGGHVGIRRERDTENWVATVAAVALQHCRQPLEGPIVLKLTFVRPKPKSLPSRPTKADPWPWVPWRRPDLDNLTKAVLDGLQGRVFSDDAQIVDLIVRKRYGDCEGVDVAARMAKPPSEKARRDQSEDYYPWTDSYDIDSELGSTVSGGC